MEKEQPVDGWFQYEYLLDLEPEERAREGLFLAFQYYLLKLYMELPLR